MDDSKVFKEALRQENLKAIKKIPKADLHNHSGLGMRFNTFSSWVDGDIKPPPSTMNGIKALEDYISNETMKYIASKEGFEFTVRAAINAAIEDGVTLLESSIDCCNLSYYRSSENFFYFIEKMIDKCKEEIEFRPEIGVARGLPENYWRKYFIPCVESDIFYSFDLYGDEKVNDLDLYKDFFEYACQNDLKSKVHVGEFCGSQQIIETIEILNPDEIQHGVNCVNNGYLVGMLKEREIRLNICPKSNVVLGAVEDIKYHPIKELYEKGVKVSINTDDLLLFNHSVSEEFLYLYRNELFNEDDLDEIRKNSLID